MEIKRTNKFVEFIKKFGLYIAVGAVVLIVSLTLGITSALRDNSVPTTTPELQFHLPMNNATILKDFSSTELQENETLGQWEAHLSIDFASDESAVMAVLGGTVQSVTTDTLSGTTIVIAHSDGFVSTYSSLAEDAQVKEGDKVEAGQKIGDASNSAGREEYLGAHLHFTLEKDGLKVDPNNYLELQNK